MTHDNRTFHAPILRFLRSLWAIAMEPTGSTSILIFILLAELVYLALSWHFPLLRLYATNPPVDFPKLVGYNWWAALALLVVYAVLFSWLARLVFPRASALPSSSRQNEVRWVKGGAALFGVTLLFLYPIFAIDMLMYGVRSRLWILYGANPLRTFPFQFPRDPWIGLTGEWVTSASGYSPLWEVLAAGLGFFAEPRYFAAHLMALKVLALGAYLGDVWLLDRILHLVWPQERARRLMYFAWNPLVVLELVGNGHNDGVMLFFLLLCLWFLWLDRELAAHAALGLAVLIKVTPVFLWPFLWLWGVLRRSSWGERIRYSAWVTFIVLVTGLSFVVFLWPDPHPWQALRESDSAGRSLQALGILAAQAFHVPHAFSRVQRGMRMVFWAGYGLILLWSVRVFVRLDSQDVRGAGLRLVGIWLTVLSLLVLLFASNWRPWYVTWFLAVATLSTSPVWFKSVFVFSFTAATGDVFWTFLRWLARGWLTPLYAHLIGIPWVFGVPIVVGLREGGPRLKALVHR